MNREDFIDMQDSGLYRADLSSVENTTLKDIDRYALDSYLKKVCGKYPDKQEKYSKGYPESNQNYGC